MRAPLCILDLRRSSVGIFEQLVVEEALLRCDHRNWLVLNSGHAQTAVVMGISGQPHKLLDVGATLRAQVPVIKRFTGGGTVIVDRNTLFVSFICNKSDVRGAPLYPRELMQWSTALYAEPFRRLVPTLPFSLQEHDYCLGNRKVGGNAQSVSRERWVHHTSWLWEFEPARMKLLSIPEKRPAYRADRPHTDFLTTLRQHAAVPDPVHFLDSIVSHVSSSWASGAMCSEGTPTVVHVIPGPERNMREVHWEESIQQALKANERKSNVYIDLASLDAPVMQ